MIIVSKWSPRKCQFYTTAHNNAHYKNKSPLHSIWKKRVKSHHKM